MKVAVAGKASIALSNESFYATFPRQYVGRLFSRRINFEIGGSSKKKNKKQVGCEPGSNDDPKNSFISNVKIRFENSNHHGG